MKIARSCKICNKETLHWPSAIKKGEGLCCSRKCLGIYRTQFLTGEKATNYRGRTIKSNCQQCGKEVLKRLWRAEEGKDKFCSRSCYEKWYSLTLRGENNPKWLGGRKAVNQRRKPLVKLWTLKNIDRLTEAKKAYYLAHKDDEHSKEVKRKSTTNYRKNHPDMIAEWRRLRRLRELGCEGNYTAQEWSELLKKYDNKCLSCGATEDLTADHVVPLTKGGTGYISNIQPLCRFCNSKKYNKEIDHRKDYQYA